MTMTPTEAKEYTDNRYRELSEGKTLTVPQKVDIVNIIIQELRGYHNFVPLMHGAPIKGTRLDQVTGEVIYVIG